MDPLETKIVHSMGTQLSGEAVLGGDLDEILTLTSMAGMGSALGPTFQPWGGLPTVRKNTRDTLQPSYAQETLSGCLGTF